jgi:hypothetical protein
MTKLSLSFYTPVDLTSLEQLQKVQLYIGHESCRREMYKIYARNFQLQKSFNLLIPSSAIPNILIVPHVCILFQIAEYWPEKGQSGYIVRRYLLRRDDEV